MAKAVVDSPEEVVAKEIQGHNLTVIELRGAKHDIGKMIGKHGQEAYGTKLNGSSKTQLPGRGCMRKTSD